jgi:D-psicose/D-tagatose/L-ribulose 3-epimerase
MLARVRTLLATCAVTPALSAVLAFAAQPSSSPIVPGRAGTVQIGYCSNLKNVEAAKAAGFEYLELGTSEIAALPDDEFEKTVQRIKDLGLPVPVTNQFIPQNIRLTGPDVNPDQQMAYLAKALARVSRLGTGIVVFGSGGARRVPDGVSKAAAFEQLVDFGRRAAVEASGRGITIAIEPLRRQETNIINSAAEGLELVRAIDHPNFQLMIDFYHLASEQENPGIVLRAKDHLRHLHVANPQGRVFPLTWVEFDYAPFFANLRTIGYDKRISVEAGSKDVPGDGARSIALLRRAFER